MAKDMVFDTFHANRVLRMHDQCMNFMQGSRKPGSKRRPGFETPPRTCVPCHGPAHSDGAAMRRYRRSLPAHSASRVDRSRARKLARMPEPARVGGSAMPLLAAWRQRAARRHAGSRAGRRLSTSEKRRHARCGARRAAFLPAACGQKRAEPHCPASAFRCGAGRRRGEFYALHQILYVFYALPFFYVPAIRLLRAVHQRLVCYVPSVVDL